MGNAKVFKPVISRVRIEMVDVKWLVFCHALVADGTDPPASYKPSDYFVAKPLWDMAGLRLLTLPLVLFVRR